MSRGYVSVENFSLLLSKWLDGCHSKFLPCTQPPITKEQENGLLEAAIFFFKFSQISYDIFGPLCNTAAACTDVQRFSFRSSFFLLLSKWLDGGCVKITSTNNPLFLDQT